MSLVCREREDKLPDRQKVKHYTIFNNKAGILVCLKAKIL